MSNIAEKEKLRLKLVSLNETINNCKEWNDYAIDLQNEYDHYLRRYNELLKEIGEI